MSGLMSLGSRAMMAAQAQLQTTGHNITNASVEGYSRQSAVLTTAQSRYTGAGYVGRGVDVSTVSRAVNSFLTDEVAQTNATAAKDRTRADLLNQLESAFGTGENGLGFATTQFFSAWSDLASNPADASARQVVLARADDVASLTRSTSGQIEMLQASVADGLNAGVAKVNELAAQVADLNQQIMAARGSSQAPNDLLDRRDQVINQISQYVQVTRIEQATVDASGKSSAGQPTNAINLVIGGGQSLVLGTSAAKLETTEDIYGGGQIGLAIKTGAESRALTSSTLGGGSLAGLLEFQNDDLSDARFQLDRLVTSMTSEVNFQQQSGLDNGKPPAAGLALFTTSWTKDMAGAYQLASQPASTNQVAGAKPTISSTDLRLLQDSDYELSADAAGGPYTLTRLADGVKTTGLLDGQLVDGFTLQIGTPAPAMGDSFLIRPFSNAAQGLHRAFDDPNLIAAADAQRQNGNALSMVSLGLKQVVDGANLADAYANILSDVGVRVQSGNSRAEVSKSVAAQAEQNLSSQTGVNLDEEAAKLIQYQQSYQAAAKILQVAQKIFDVVLGMANG